MIDASVCENPEGGFDDAPVGFAAGMSCPDDSGGVRGELLDVIVGGKPVGSKACEVFAVVDDIQGGLDGGNVALGSVIFPVEERLLFLLRSSATGNWGVQGESVGDENPAPVDADASSSSRVVVEKDEGVHGLFGEGGLDDSSKPVALSSASSS